MIREKFEKTSQIKHESNGNTKVNAIKLPDKRFQERNSLLTDLYEINHIKTIYNIFIVIFTLLLLNVFISDFVSSGKINFGLSIIAKGFRKIHIALLLWASMQVTVLGLYPMFCLWSKITQKISFTNAQTAKLWNSLCICSVIIYQIAFIIIFTKMITQSKLGKACSFSLLLELVRNLMKTHAFIRTNVPRVINSKIITKSDDNTKLRRNIVPTFSQYVYFLFAPTLIYRDEYPRSKQICWNFVIKRFIEVISVILIISFTFERFMYPTYSQFGSKFNKTGVKQLIISIFNTMLPSLLLFVSAFYCILHSWMNAFAELMRFSDRQFYSDWWNATNFKFFYRSWNIVVHDWLYTYVYKDLYENIFIGNRTICQFLVFSLSAIFHEYILGFTFNFFYPILFIEFQGIGVLLFFLMNKDLKTFGNCFIWFAIAFGYGTMISLFHMEYYARENCSYDRENWINYFRPISFSSCDLNLKLSDDWKVQF